ncbi:UspA [Corchorus capsularis]|uniref:UspA n=1 Tax=Corchorus capsularis TaxID=210143 RepID=A0A1R3GZJ3_COCAP|nr:UspA [Corchorus capsularis]
MEEEKQQFQKKVMVAIDERDCSYDALMWVKVETVTEVGNPKEIICNAVENYKINLLVVGDQADGILQRIFQESLSSYCLKNAKCPVLVVKKSDVQE